MKTSQVAAVVASLASSALAQFPPCANNCVSQILSGFGGNIQQLCQDSGRLNALNSCLSTAGCSGNDRNNINNYISSNCNNAFSNSQFATPTFNSFNSFATPYQTNGWSGWNNPAAQSAFNSYTAAHPNGWSGPDYSSFTSQYGPAPTNFGGQNGGNVGSNWGGSGGWGGPFGMGAGGWSPANGGPFGSNNWGPFGSAGPWTTGAWTSWWDGDKCPPATWPGWTTGSWSTNAPWTTWTACTARTTAASVYTTYYNGQPTTATSFGYQVAQAQQTGITFGNSANAGRTVASGAAALAFLGAVLVA